MVVLAVARPAVVRPVMVRPVVVLADAAAGPAVAAAVAVVVVVPLMPGQLVLVVAEESMAHLHRLQAVQVAQSA